MSTPVKYGDISREANDLFTKDFPLDGVKFDAKTTQKSGESYSLKTTYDKSGVLTAPEASVDLKFRHGISSTIACALDASTLSASTKISSLAPYFKVKGVSSKIDVKVPLDVSAGKSPEVKISADYVHPRFITSGAYDHSKEALTADAVSVYKGFVLGTQVGVSAKTFDVTKYEGTVGYTYGKLAGAVALTDKMNSVSAWLFTALTPYMDTVFQAKHDLRKTTTFVEAATKFYYDNDTTFKAKINSDALLGLSAALQVNPGMKVAFSTSTNCSQVYK